MVQVSQSFLNTQSPDIDMATFKKSSLDFLGHKFIIEHILGTADPCTLSEDEGFEK